MTAVTGNRQLAARARELADVARSGTLARKAAGAACIALATSKSLTAARGVIEGGDGPESRVRLPLSPYRLACDLKKTALAQGLGLVRPGRALSPLVVEPDQCRGRAGAVAGEGGDQPVLAGHGGAVGTGHGHVHVDHADRHVVQPGQVGPVGQVPGYREVAGGLGPRQQHRPGTRHLGQERAWVIAQVAATIDETVATAGATAPVVIAKSLGSLAAPLVADRGLAAAWFTPLLTDEPQWWRCATAPCLLVGGTADRCWDGPVARSVTRHVSRPPQPITGCSCQAGFLRQQPYSSR